MLGGALGSALGWRWRLSYRGRLPLSSIRGVGQQQQQQAASWAAELDSAGLTEIFFFSLGWVGCLGWGCVSLTGPRGMSQKLRCAAARGLAWLRSGSVRGQFSSSSLTNRPAGQTETFFLLLGARAGLDFDYIVRAWEVMPWHCM